MKKWKNNSFKIVAAIFIFSISRFGFCQTSTSLDKAKLAIIEGDYIEAIGILKNVTENNSHYNKACHLLGLAYYETEDYEKAIDLLQKTASLKGPNPDIKILLAKANDKLGQTPTAIKIFKEVLREDSLNAKAQRNLARVYFREKNYTSALGIYENLLLLEKSKNHLFRQAGLCAFRLKQYNNAKNLFHRALKLNTKDLRAYAYLGNTYLKIEQPEAALQAITNGLKIYPQSKVLLKLKGDLLFQEKSYADAIQAYLKIENTEIMNAGAYNKLGLSYYYLNNYAAALLAMQKANEEDSSNALNLYYLGLTFQKLKNYKKAILYLERSADKIIPEYTVDIYAQLASCYDNEKKYKKAIKAYKRAMSINGARKVYLFFIASLYDRYYKDRQIPLDYYRRFLEENPDADDKYKNYAMERIKALKEKLHFQK